MEMDLKSFAERPRPFRQTYVHHIWNVFQNVCRDLSELRHLVWGIGIWNMGIKDANIILLPCFSAHSSFPSTVSLWTVERVSHQA